MKSIKNERATEEEDEYPCLMTDRNGLVILFTHQYVGTVVSAQGCNNLGEFCENWDSEDFTTYHGTITLEN